ncbi:unnamed protein product [Adineta ricciae]|uniref:Uncharacterized protein n=1 Tax=Adineta ricciae TaxID=249248 RepID=A0A815LSX0_ADIRI|nr:unnamed protein product [Adineta ricciae]CAF1638870.1 unnamed protein product [Adineta ricciae]
MIVVPTGSVSIHVSVVQHGCCQSGFDLTYPPQLNGIISQVEYQESIQNINNAFASKLVMLFSFLVLLICIIAGVALIIIGGLTASASHSSGFSVLMGIGIGVLIGSFLIAIIINVILQYRERLNLRRTIATESMKYTSKSPIPSSWRLHTRRVYRRGNGRSRTSTLIYTLIIDLGNPSPSNVSNISYGSNQIYPYPPPSAPQYNVRPAAAFCSQCGIARQNPSMKFCSSCGQAFNN